MKRTLLVVVLTATSCTPFEELGEVARCRLRGCDGGVDAGPTPDAGQPPDGGPDAGPDGDAGSPSDAGVDAGGPSPLGECDRPGISTYVQRVSAEWRCVREGLLASADGGVGAVLPPVKREVTTPIVQGFAGGALLPDGRVVGFPNLERQLMFVNPDDTIDFKPFEASQTLRYEKPDGGARAPVASGVLGSDGRVYLCPGEDPVFVALDLPFDGGFDETNDVRSRAIGLDASVLPDDAGRGWSGCVTAPGLGVFSVPQSGRFVLALPFDGGAVELIDLTRTPGYEPPASGGVDQFFGAQLAPGGNIVGIPYGEGANRFMALDPLGQRRVRYLAVPTLPPLLPIFPPGLLRGSVIRGDGTIIAVPSATTSPLGLRVDVNLELVSFPDGGGSPSRFAFGGVLADDRLFQSSFGSLGPVDAGWDGGLDVYSFSTRTYSTLALPAGLDVSGFGASVGRFDGTLVFIPRKDRFVLFVPTGSRVPVPRGARLSPFVNHF